jgi:GWxTD domain-containing protein
MWNAWIGRALVLACVMLPAQMQGAGQGQAQVDSLIAEASIGELPQWKRVDLLEGAVRLDSTGRAMHALGQLYLAQDSHLGRRVARRWMKKAIEREPDNADYRMSLAEVHLQGGSYDRFYEEAVKAIDRAPDHVGALYGAGQYAAREMMVNLDREVIKTGWENKRRFDYGRYGKRMRDLAIDYLSRALAADPSHRAARFLLGQVYYEARMGGRLVELFEDYQKRHPKDRDAWFFIGLGHQEQENLGRALQAYSEGLRRLSEPERRFIQSIVMIADTEDAAAGNSLPAEEDLRAYWTGRDPLFLTPENERLMEHCRRVAYANLRYGDPARELDGWMTDRGQAYIRYGQPVTRNLHMDRLNYISLMETWSYPDFEITFKFIGGDHWRVVNVWIRGTALSRYDDLVERVPEFYDDPYWLKRFEVPFQIAQFRGREGKTRVELYYGLPGEHVTHSTEHSGVEQVDVKQGMFLFDAGWDTLSTSVHTISKMPWVSAEGTTDGYLFWGEKLDLAPGRYHLAVEMEDQASKSLGAFRDSLEVRHFGESELEVSGVLAARRVVERDEGTYGRDRFMVLANPMEECPMDGSISFYFEVYNLSRDEFGTTDYRVTYQMRLLSEEPEDEEATPEWSTAVSSSHKGNRDWEPSRLTLDMEGASPGPWAFRVMVEDNQAGSRAMEETVFRVRR